MRDSRLYLAVAVALNLIFVASVAQAGPDVLGSVDIVEPNGFPGVCAQPCYTITKEFEVWFAGNPGNPLPLAGNNTYIYKLTHAGGTGFFVPALTGLEIQVDTAFVTGAGHIATSPGVAPGLVTVGAGKVRWDFLAPPLGDGQMSKLLYVHSPLLPGTILDNVISINAQAALDAPGTCVGPFLQPAVACNLTVAKEGCVVQPPDVIGDSCDGKVTSFSFQYTGLGCTASSNLQNPKKVECKGGAALDEPVDILVTGKKRKRWGHGWGWWGKKHHRKTLFAAVSGVNVGDTIVVDASNAGKQTIGSKTYVKISTGNGGHDLIELDKFHTSCSQPFGPGNQFGSVLVTSVTSTEGGTITIDPEIDGEECVTSLDVVPAPHCEGKVNVLRLRYTGSDCGATLTSQDPSEVGCVDAAAPTIDPVRIVVSESSGATTYLDQSPVSGGDIVDVAASAAGKSQLGSSTGYQILNAVTGDLIQNGFFHTSCSQPLNLGDKIGALEVFGLDTTQGGTVALGSEVEYTYAVSNPNTSQAVNVSVDDNLLGNIASGVSIAAGGSATFMTTAVIEVETTNIATVTGEVSGVVCEPAVASATITVTEPPPTPTICTKKIAAMLLRYTGPDILGATVAFEAKSFDYEQVVYGPVDLIGGVTVLSMPAENGFTIDGTAHGETDLGSKTMIFINGVGEEIHTSCSTPFATDAAAPLNEPKGAPSPNWFVVDFTEKQSHHHGESDHN